MVKSKVFMCRQEVLTQMGGTLAVPLCCSYRGAGGSLTQLTASGE